ncbi:TlyA family RNA methyltransferase [Isachenkonia alkalipeptolytica]|uniref:TlyA family RNA methyltransferase n=1 Tax=Isachenkonia alkalipeptolytica TaxID=2565777 RepID=A0AA43XKZ6_9CLOT|nr:TlyA family RNA methyltransferase [Isachenkonia alkalipeptolytica]NBG88778.1 TlyA family RNA methyltransferase [Isachenkonia alkalipeptolytica]
MKKERLDILLVDKGLLDSREKAKRRIMSGTVFVDGQRCDKPGMKVAPEASIDIKGKSLPFVSRGGLKLKKAVEEFGLDLSNTVCLDIGSSTGGFTDCMLQEGARKVFSIDVGYGQLAYKLRQDPRVVVMERTNIRHVTLADIKEKADFISVDVSFISLKLVLPVAKKLLKENGCMVVLIKPQFEAGRGKVGKNGVIRNPQTHREVLIKVIDFIQEENIGIAQLSFSPIQGPKGNMEFLAYLQNQNDYWEKSTTEDNVERVVSKAHDNFEKSKV